MIVRPRPFYDLRDMKATYFIFMTFLLVFLVKTEAQHFSMKAEEYSESLSRIEKTQKRNLKFKAGIRFGYLQNRVKLSRLDEYRGIYPQGGISVGAYVGMAHEPYFERFMIHLEFMYDQINARGSVEVDQIPNEVDFTLNAIRVPVLFSYTFPGSAVRPVILLGPSLGRMISQKGRIDYQGVDYLPELQITPLVVSGTFGVGAMVPIQEKIEISLDARYNLGYINIFDTFSQFKVLLGVGF